MVRIFLCLLYFKIHTKIKICICPLGLIDESQMTPIQYTKNINGIACLVKAIRNVQKTIIQKSITKYSLCHVQPNLLTRMNEKE